MAKYVRRYRRYRKTGRWSTNISRIATTDPALQGPFANSITIAQNNTSTSSSTISQTFTVKNVEVSGILEAQGNIDNIEYYIMYVPQGYAIGTNLPFEHPEWIMAYKFVGKNSYPNYADSAAQPVKVKTRLSRKLNTGDSLIFFYCGINNNNVSVPINMQALVRWWTKAN